MSSANVESAETSVAAPPAKKSIKSWFTKKRLIIIALVAAVLAALGIGAAIYAASIPVGTIKVFTYDDTNNGHVLLGNVVVTVNSVNSSAECGDNTKKTFPDSDTRHGTVEFYNCKARPYSKPNRKYLRYSIASAVRDGYQIKHGSKFKRNEVGVLEKSGGSFVVRANKTTNVEILLEKQGTPQVQTRTAPDPTTGGTRNPGNIVFAKTHHSYNYALAQPDDNWISNYTNSYYIGSVKPGWSIDLVTLRTGGLTTDNGYMFGLIRRANGDEVGCGWIEPGTVSTNPLQATTNHCSNHIFRQPQKEDADINRIRETFGTLFTCKKGDRLRNGTEEDKCNTPVTLDPQDMNPGCSDPRLYRNYFSNNNYDGGSFSDPVKDSSGNDALMDLSKTDALRYRYTTKDGKAAVVAGPSDNEKVNAYGWGFIHRDCINGNPTDSQYWDVRHPNYPYPPPPA